MKKIETLFFLLMFLQLPVYAEVDSAFKEGVQVLSRPSIQLVPECELNELSLSQKFSDNGADCSKFIKNDGTLGELGTVIKNHLQSLGSKSIFFNEDFIGFNQVCPNYKELSPEAKSYFIVWLMASISHTESTCKQSAVNEMATHGIAIGLLQLNKKRRDRAWRGGTTGNSCSAKFIANSEDNLKCGLEILNEQLKGKEGLYQGSGELFGRKSNSYWEHLRKKNGGKIIKLAKEFPLCGIKKGPH